MSWFNRHINWTYIFCLAFAFLVSFLIYFVVYAGVDTSDPSYGLRVYLDENYKTEWDDTNIPDLDTLIWEPSGQEGWEVAELVVFLENESKSVLEVEFSETESPQYATLGFDVSSDPVIINPGERIPVVITIEENLFSLAISGSSGTHTIYWLISPVAPDESTLDMITIVVVAAIMIGAAVWLLNRKGRNYAWVLLSLSGIGVIVFLCLANKKTIIIDDPIDKIPG